MVNNKVFDIAVIGGGPSGLAAAIYGLREGLSVIILEKTHIGGNLNIINTIENYPGYDVITGRELTNKLEEQVLHLGATIKEHGVAKIVKENNRFQIIDTENEVVHSKSVIITTGTRERHLGVPGETELVGRGVSYCSLCDGPLFRNKLIAVVGGGDRAYTEALHLSSFAKKIYLLQHSNTPKAEKINIEHVLKKDNIEIHEFVEVLSINGERKVESVTLKNLKTGETNNLEVNAVFPLIGSIPNTEFLRDLDILDDRGNVCVDKDMQTSIEGIYAAGDVICKTIRQVVTATGDGAIAGAMASRYVKLLEE